jgi:hypothetical protein
MSNPLIEEFVMPEKYTPNPMQTRAEALPAGSGWSKAEFVALERRWSFLERVGDGKVDAEGIERI